MQKTSISGFRHLLSIPNLLYAGILTLLLPSLLLADVKATMIRGLMKMGMFRPDFSAGTAASPRKNWQDLILVDTAGKEIALSSLKGKIVLLNFWATWCPPCRAELPSLQKLSRRWKDRSDLVVLTIDVDGKLPEARKFLDRRHLSLPVYAASGYVPSALLGQAVPTTDVFDKSGALVTHYEGAVDFDTREMDTYLTDLR